MSDEFLSVKPTTMKLEVEDIYSSDESSIVRIPIRQYSYRGTEYTVMVCADYKNHRDIFYYCSFRRMADNHDTASTESDRQILNRLMRSHPIPTRMRMAGERKLFDQIKEKRAGYVMNNLLEIFDEARETISGKKKAGNKKVAKKGSKVQKKKVATIEDEGGVLGMEEDGGGLMGIYCRSEIHADFSG